MSIKVEFSHEAVHSDDAQYLRNLLDMGVGMQEANLMVAIRNGAADGDVILLEVPHSDDASYRGLDASGNTTPALPGSLENVPDTSDKTLLRHDAPHTQINISRSLAVGGRKH